MFTPPPAKPIPQPEGGGDRNAIALYALPNQLVTHHFLPQAALRAGARTAGRSTLRNALMGVEVGLAMIVIMAAALFVRGFSETRDTDPGFKRDGVLLAPLTALAVADLVLDDREAPELALTRPARFGL